MDTLLGILRRAALINESRPDRGYAALDRTRAFGARVGRRVGGARIYIEQIAGVASALLRVDRHCLFVIHNGPVDLAAGLDFVAGSQVKININERARRVRMQFALALPEIGLLAREAESGHAPVALVLAIPILERISQCDQNGPSDCRGHCAHLIFQNPILSIHFRNMVTGNP